jgi:hypothetical protein
MNHILPFVQMAGPSSDPDPSLYSDHMLAELLALQQDMIAQLRLERLRVANSADFLTGVIDQHEKAAAMLRMQLENYTTDTTNDGLTVLTREDRSDAEISPGPRFA